MFNFEGHSIAVMVCFPNAKINIGLYVTEKRADGYHDLETVFFPVPVYDALEIVPAPDGRTSIFLSGLEITGDVTGNLVWKAWEMIARQFPDDVSQVHIYLGKAIPMGAGMGGGSADGTFMLLLLNRTACSICAATGQRLPFLCIQQAAAGLRPGRAAGGYSAGCGLERLPSLPGLSGRTYQHCQGLCRHYTAAAGI